MVEMKVLGSHEEWLKARTKIGGSDASAIFGMSPYKTNVELFKEKAYGIEPEDISDKPYVKYGTEAEKHLSVKRLRPSATPTKARACAHAEVGKPRKKSEPVKYSDDPELNDAIVEFIKFRKGIKKPMSDRAITLMMNKLESLSHDKHEQVQILNQSIMQGWTGLYALKDDGKSRGQPRNVNPNGFANFKQTDHSEQLGQLEKMLADELNK